MNFLSINFEPFYFLGFGETDDQRHEATCSAKCCIVHKRIYGKQEIHQDNVASETNGVLLRVQQVRTRSVLDFESELHNGKG